MKQHTLDGKECNPAKFPNIEDLEKILAEQYLMIEESYRQKNHEKKLSDIEKLKELKGRIEEGKVYLSSRFHQTAKKYDLNRNVLKETMKTGEKKKFEECIKSIEEGDESSVYFAEKVADKYWLDKTKLKRAVEKGLFEKYLEEIENGNMDDYWHKTWDLTDKYDFDGNRIIKAADRFAEAHIWDDFNEGDYCVSCCKECLHTENCGEANTHQCYQHSIKHGYCLS